MARVFSDEMEGDEANFLFLLVRKLAVLRVYEQTMAEIDHKRAMDNCYPLEALEVR